MPYIITTRPPNYSDPTPERRKRFAAHVLVTRIAVATLDEAREAVRSNLTGHGWQLVEHRTAVDTLPESGGTIGPLPDGTVIEVRPVALWDLADAAGWQHPHLDDGAHHEDTAAIVAAFNEAQGS